MKQKESSKTNRTLIAQELTKLSGSIADGRLEIKDKVVELGDFGVLKIEKKVKHDTVSVKVEIKLPLSLMSQQKSNNGLYQGASSRKSKGQNPSYKAKKIKKEMGSVWKIIKKAIKSGSLPAEEDLKTLWRTKDEYEEFVEAAWEGEWIRCVDHIKAALDAARQGDFETASNLLNQADKAKSECHKKYK